MKYRGEKEWRAYEDGNDHWLRSSALFEEIKEAVAEVVDQEHATTITSDFTARMERLAEEADNFPLPSEDRPARLRKERSTSIFDFQRWFSRVAQYVSVSWEAFTLVLLERYKLSPRLTAAKSINYPREGDEFLF